LIIDYRSLIESFHHSTSCNIIHELFTMMQLKRPCLALLPLTSRLFHMSTTSRCMSTTTITSTFKRFPFQSRDINSSHQSIYNYKYLDSSNSFIKELEEHRHLPSSQLGIDPTSNRFHQPIVYHPQYSFSSWPTNHTFPMSKFHHTSKALLTKQPHLPRPLLRSMNDYYMPLHTEHIPYDWIAQPHGPIDSTFLQSFLTATLSHEQQRNIGFRELCSHPDLIQRTLLEVSGTILTSHLAYRYGLATHVAGGTHHAQADRGAGYTILNDLVISANYMMKTELNGGNILNVDKVLVIDCDVHQGDGTASFGTNICNHGNGIERDSNGNGGELYTLSIHCQSNYPFRKQKSTYDVGLPDNMTDDEYIQILKENVNLAIQEIQPDFIIYDAGVDVYENDVLGNLKITEEGIRKRDRWVIEKCVREGIPICGVVGGGYDKDINALARRHAILHEEGAYVWRKYKLWSRHKQ